MMLLLIILVKQFKIILEIVMFTNRGELKFKEINKEKWR
jgi:hypothetical protein